MSSGVELPPEGTTKVGGPPSSLAAVPKCNIPPMVGGPAQRPTKSDVSVGSWRRVESWDPYLVHRHVKPLLSPCPTVMALTHCLQIFHLLEGRSSAGLFLRACGTISSPVELEGSMPPC